ncbi:MAG: vWA domain-containing protein, partial [Planctomycetaceae bacterium]
VVILVDRSASMAAADTDGNSRLDEAKQTIEQRVAGLPAGVGVVVMAYDTRPEVLLARTVDRREIRRTLDRLAVRPVAGDAEAALRLAGQLAALETPAAIWHATDAAETREERRERRDGDEEPSPPALDLAGDPDLIMELPTGVRLDRIAVTLPRPVNVGITAFRLRPLPLQRARFEAFVQVRSSAPRPVRAELEVLHDGTPVALRKLQLEPHQPATLLIPVDADADRDKVLTLRVNARRDVLPIDDAVHARVPRLQPVRVLWISEQPDPFTQLALTTLGEGNHVQVLHGPPSAWPPKDPVDVVIFDGWLPESLPKDAAVIVINPPGPVGSVRAVRLSGDGLPLD